MHIPVNGDYVETFHKAFHDLQQTNRDLASVFILSILARQLLSFIAGPGGRESNIHSSSTARAAMKLRIFSNTRGRKGKESEAQSLCRHAMFSDCFVPGERYADREGEMETSCVALRPVEDLNLGS